MEKLLPTKIFSAVFVVFSFFLTGCEKDIENEEVEGANPRVEYDNLSENPWVVYLVEPGNELSFKNSNHIRKALNYAKIPYNEINRFDFNKKPEVGNSVKVIVIYDLEPLNKNAMNFLIEFVVKGGHIFIPSVGTNKNFGFLAGVRGDANFEIDTISQGFKFQSSFLPALKGKQYRNENKHFGLQADNYRENIEILATSISEENYPLIIKNKIGNGSVITFNTDQYSQKQERGLFFAAILQGLEGVPYPVANASSIMLDDFPAPLYNVKMEPVTSEMDISQARFYTEVWWKDMLKLAREEGLEYSAYVCFDYSNRTSPPFNFPEWEQSVLTGSNGNNAADKLMVDFQNSTHEVALHGYNHASLTGEVWPNKNYMGLSLKAVKKRWAARNYGQLPVSYVPPSNIIDSTGFVALEENIPEIIYNASIYLGNFEDGGDREFDSEPYNNHFFNFPRITSGFSLTSTRQFNQQSLYLYTGVWTHFIHPDDIYQIPGEEPRESAGDYTLRNINSYGWRVSEDGSPGLFPRFRQYIKDVKKTFPLIRFLKVSEAAKITQNWREIPYNFTENDSEVEVAASIQNTENQNFWFAYISEKNTTEAESFLKSKQFKFTKTPFLDGYLFNIQTREKKLSLPKFENNYSKDFSEITHIYESYLLIEPSEDLGDIDKEIDELKSKIAESSIFEREDWLKLFQYLGWNNRQNEIWPLLERKYSENKSSVYVNLSSEFTTQNDYPHLEIRKRWMLRQIDLQPENLKLRKDFIDYFGSNSEVQLSKGELLTLIERTKVDAELSSYLSLLNEKHPEAALNLVKGIEPCWENFRLAASTISWIFADAKQYSQALQWSTCSDDIAESAIDYWRVQMGEYEFLKEGNFPLYIEYLIADNNKKAAQKLLEIEACREDLKHLAATISYTYSDQGSYRKALEWSSCVPDFPLAERMQWFYSLENFSEVERLYANYSKKDNPKEKEAIQIFMTEYYLGRSEMLKSWELASELPESNNKERLRRQLNNTVVFLNTKLKRQLLEEYPSIFYPEVSSKIKQNLRITEGDFVQIGSNIISDRLDPTSVGLEAVFGTRDKKLNQHQFGLSRYNAYSIPFQGEQENNEDMELHGLVYRFKTRERIEKFNFGLGSRLEFNETGRAYLHVEASASIAKDSLYSSFQFFRKPAITGPAYILDIYQTQLNVYEELQFKEKFQAVFYIEGNHYNDEDIMDVQALTSLSMDFKLNKMAKFRPYTEFSGMLGNSNRSNGFPYWTLDERFYGGLGMAYEYVNENNFWKINLDAGYFLDTFSDEFQRYRGSVVWPVTKYLHLNTQAEFFTLKNFYSNNFTFGLKYFLKDN
ncbi:hypothetical protein APR41_05950 [Salegentibacter salinarum]|uniref:DUF2194 domain-containing protein n=1 Tax=Salegentibacter salinarum TaxID=447422 RepID=A0A2N0TQH7_9FLAO|nr:DUF2194 domain-containing protein [Salegentibacter salinarum]PKD16980.1 hypothetical protein APR41_05950 [Salegentibacter salinarum]SKB53291.1 hypothetical protein SAMN05660903_01213 [Salegentibacter salinarum]